MKRKLFAIAMAFVMVFSTAVFAYANTDTGVSLYDTDTVVFSISRSSRTSASVTVDVDFTQVVDSYNVVIYLQKKVDGEWVLDTTNPDYVFYNNGFHASGFTFYHKYTSLQSNVTYRIRCISKDYIGSQTYNTSSYSNPF